MFTRTLNLVIDPHGPTLASAGKPVCRRRLQAFNPKFFPPSNGFSHVRHSQKSNASSRKPPRGERSPTRRCSISCSVRPSSTSGMARIPAAGLRATACSGSTDPTDDAVAIGGSGFGVMAIDRRLRARLGHARAGARPRLADARPPGAGHLLSRRSTPISCTATPARPCRSAARTTAPISSRSAFLFQGLLCAPRLFRPRRAGGEAPSRSHQLFVVGSGMGLVHARRTNSAYLALEPDQRLRSEPSRARLERMPRRLYSRPPRRRAIRSRPKSIMKAGRKGAASSTGRVFEGVELPLGPDWGGPLFFTHYSFCGIDPRGLSDNYADYWAQNVAHTRINYEYCVRNPHGYKGYGPDCWGLTAGDSIRGYAGACSRSGRGRHHAERGAVELPLHARRGDGGAPPFPRGPGRLDLGPLRLHRRLQRAVRLARRQLSRRSARGRSS